MAVAGVSGVAGVGGGGLGPGLELGRASGALAAGPGGGPEGPTAEGATGALGFEMQAEGTAAGVGAGATQPGRFLHLLARNSFELTAET